SRDPPFDPSGGVLTGRRDAGLLTRLRVGRAATSVSTLPPSRMLQRSLVSRTLVVLTFVAAVVSAPSSQAQSLGPDEGAAESEVEPEDDGKRKGPRYPGLRTFGELSIILGVGTLWYWIERDRNVVDWDLDSWRQRFSKEAYRFDNNSIGMNFLGHT